MPLPSTNLTLHLDASDNSTLFKTYVSGGPNTGTPSDGDVVEVCEDFTGANKIAKKYSSNAGPNARITTPLMALQCLDFNVAGTTGMVLTNKSGTSLTLDDVIAAGAFTLFIAIYPEAIGGGVGYLGTGIITDAGGYWGLFKTNDGGTSSVSAYNYDGTQDYVSTPCSYDASHVVMMRHESGNVYLSVDDGSEVSMASGDTSNMGFDLLFGRGGFAHWEGRWGEIAIYDAALTGSNFTDAYDYFMNKWINPPAATARTRITFFP